MSGATLNSWDTVGRITTAKHEALYTCVVGPDAKQYAPGQRPTRVSPKKRYQERIGDIPGVPNVDVQEMDDVPGETPRVLSDGKETWCA